MFYRLCSFACLVAFLAGCGSGDPGTGPSPPPPPPPPPPSAPVVTVSVFPSAVERASGNSAVIDWNATHAQSCSSFWGENVGTSGSYSIIPTTPISGAITCVGEGGSKSEPISISIVEPPHLRIGLISADVLSGISGLSIRLRSGSFDSTIALSGATLDMPLYEALRSRFSGDSIDVTIDRQGNSARAFIPLVGRIGRTLALTGQNLSVVLIPSVWNISCGTYSGSQIGVSLQKAYLPANETSAGFYSTNWFWEQFPQFVALDRSESTVSISAQDSVGMWNQIAKTESALCIDLYKPGSLADIAVSGGTRIVVNTSFPPGMANGGFTRRNLSSPYIYFGLASFQNVEMLPTRVLEHELIHTLGFGHSCFWPTTMFSFCPNESEVNRPGITAEDVAYIRLFYAVRKLEVDRNSVLGLSASLRGEREIILGLPSTVSTTNASPPNTRTLQVLFDHR